MSFMLTTEQVRNKTKDVTRRDGWKKLKEGDILNACKKCMGLKKGEKVEVICQIRVVDVSFEPLIDITPHELIREGFSELSTHEFIQMFCNSHKGCTPEKIITRIEFEYI